MQNLSLQQRGLLLAGASFTHGDTAGSYLIARYRAVQGGARAALTTTELEAALTDAGKSVDTSKARQQFADLCTKIEFSEARISGLKSRLAIADDAVTQVREAMRLAWTELHRQQIAA